MTDLHQNYGRAILLCPNGSLSYRFHDRLLALTNVAEDLSVYLEASAERTSLGPIRTMSPILSAKKQRKSHSLTVDTVEPFELAYKR